MQCEENSFQTEEQSKTGRNREKSHLRGFLRRLSHVPLRMGQW